jgi:hypothetical protein
MAPVVERLATRVLAAYIVRTDATGLKVLDPTSPEHVQRGSIWAMIGDEPISGDTVGRPNLAIVAYRAS